MTSASLQGGGAISNVLPLMISFLFAYMGLTMLDILPLPALPAPAVAVGEDSDVGQLGRAYLFGASSALVPL